MATLLTPRSSVQAPPSPLAAMGRWWAEMVHHAFGDPRTDDRLQPPAVGVQPFSGSASRRRRPWH